MSERYVWEVCCWQVINVSPSGITCDGPEDALNIKPIPASIADGMDFEQTYTYECAEGYSTDDPLCVVCQSNGSLSIGAPTCSGNNKLYRGI